MKTAAITLMRDELLYDVRNSAYVEGDIMSPDTEDSKHQVFDVGEDGNVDRVTRVFDLAFAECSDLLYPWTKEKMEDYDGRSDTFVEREAYMLDLHLPEDFSQTTLTYLERLIHEYMVCRALADWLSVTKPDAAANWADKAEKAKEDINNCKNRRCGVVRIKPHPF